MLFFLLMTASTVLLVLGEGLLIRTNARIDAAEGEFKTIGIVTQKPISEATVPVTNTCSDYLNTYTVQTFKEILSPDILNFDGAEYKIAPRNRAYYLSVMPELNNTLWLPRRGVHFGVHAACGERRQDDRARDECAL